MSSAPGALARALPAVRPGAASAVRHRLPPHRIALIAIVGLAVLLECWWLDREGTANSYYAAAVRSMTENPAAFFFGAFDAGGFITLDKPPAGFWVQALFAIVLGYGGLALLLPQALATIGSVALAYGLVRRPWGVRAGLLAALALAVTPITVATGRNNTPDMTLVFVILCAAWSLQRGIASGRLRWLALAMALIGVGFNVKMLEAYLVLPAFGAAWLVAAPGSIRRRTAQLAVAAIPLVAVSLAWVAIVDLTPAASRPYVGGSTTNSALELAFGYNGIERLNGGMVFPDTGTPGPLRFLEPVLAGQVGWLLTFAIAGGLAALPVLRRRRRSHGARLRLQRGSLVLWGGWLVTTLVFFSVARFWHRHYLVMVAPAVAAMAGFGALALWRAYRRGRPSGWLIPAAVLATALLAQRTIAATTEFAGLADPVLVMGILLAAALGAVPILIRLGRTDRAVARRTGAGLLAGALAVALLPPAAWSAWTAVNPSGSSLPTGGPAVAGVGFGPGGGFPGGFPGGGRGGVPGVPGGVPGAPGVPSVAGQPNPFGDPVSSSLLDYLVANRGGATWLAAVSSAQQAASTIIGTGLPMMAIGGFSGADPAITVDGFRALVAAGRIRFVVAGGLGGGQGGGAPGLFGALGGLGGPGGRSRVLEWATTACQSVSGYTGLYDCAGAGG